MSPADISLFDFESYFYRTESMDRLHGLEDYLAVMEAQLANLKDKEAARLKKDLEDIPDSWSESDQFSFTNWREDQCKRFEQFFPENFRYSFIVLLCLAIEDELKHVCDEIQCRKGLTPRPRNPRGGIKQYMDILADKDIGGVPIEKITHWPKISDLAKIRNCIAHTSGLIDESKDGEYLNSLARKQSGLQIDGGQLSVEPDYCKLATQNTIEFFNEIFDGTGFKFWKESNNR